MNPAPRVLYLTYDGLLEPLGSSQVTSYLVRLADAGVRLSVVSFEKSADLADGERVRALATDLRSRGITWHRRRYHSRPSLPATLADVVAGRRVVRRWLGQEQAGPGPRVIHARSYVAGLMAVGLFGDGRSVAETRFVFDMRGFWVDERIQGGYWRPGSTAVRLGRWAEGRLLAAADHLILLTEKARERLPDLAPEGRVPPATVIPTCVDLDRFRPPRDRSGLRRELGLLDRPVLVHVGTLTGWYDGAATLAVAREWIRLTGGLFLVLTRDVEAARRLAAEAGVEAMVRTVRHDEVPRWMAAASAGLALVRPSPAKDGSFPTKIGEYLATGLPVLATPVGDVGSLATPGVLETVGPDIDPVAGAMWLRDAARCEPASAARELARERLDLEGGVAKLIDLYRDLTAGGPS